MTAMSSDKSTIVDDLDLRITHSLQVSPRAPFALIGTVLGVSEQTVARRYRRLRDARAVRVVGLVDPSAFGQQNWSLRLACRPDASEQIARALARRDDVHWVALLSGGTEVVCVLRARSAQERDHLLLRQLPRTAQIDSITAYGVLHVFRGGMIRDWRVGGSLLTAEQEARLLESATARDNRPASLTPADEPMLQELLRNGRATYAALRATANDGRSDAQLRRRVEELTAAGVLTFDVDVDDAQFGRPVRAYMSLTVTPAQLQAVGDALSEHDAVRYAAAVTGPASVVANTAFSSVDDLYRFVAEDLGKLDGVAQVQVLPISKAIKQGGACATEPDQTAWPTR